MSSPPVWVIWKARGHLAPLRESSTWPIMISGNVPWCRAIPASPNRSTTVSKCFKHMCGGDLRTSSNFYLVQKWHARACCVGRRLALLSRAYFSYFSVSSKWTCRLTIWSSAFRRVSRGAVTCTGHPKVGCRSGASKRTILAPWFVRCFPDHVETDRPLLRKYAKIRYDLNLKLSELSDICLSSVPQLLPAVATWEVLTAQDCPGYPRAYVARNLGGCLSALVQGVYRKFFTNNTQEHHEVTWCSDVGCSVGEWFVCCFGSFWLLTWLRGKRRSCAIRFVPAVWRTNRFSESVTRGRALSTSEKVFRPPKPSPKASFVQI